MVFNQVVSLGTVQVILLHAHVSAYAMSRSLEIPFININEPVGEVGYLLRQNLDDLLDRGNLRNESMFFVVLAAVTDGPG